MTESHAHIAGCLYDRQPDAKLNNVKFFRGDAHLIRSEHFRDENRRIDAQKRDGTASSDGRGPRVTKEKINFRDYVS